MADPFADAPLADYVAQASQAFGELDVAQLRDVIAARAALRTPGPDLHAVTAVTAGQQPARLYRPSPAPGAVVLYLHGGGWTIGSIESHDRMCRRLAHRSGLAVLSLGFRLAPEDPWPASVEDTVAALQWIAGRPAELHGCAERVAVGGDSAGGTLGALACLRLRDTGPDALPSLQVLLYANTDLSGGCPSMVDKAHGWGLDVETIRFFNRQWVPDESRWSDPGVSPLHAPDLADLPQALIVSAEHDPLRDESEAYGRRLVQAGVLTTVRREPGLIHNFMLLDEVSPACAAAADRVADDIRMRLQQ